MRRISSSAVLVLSLVLLLSCDDWRIAILALALFALGLGLHHD